MNEREIFVAALKKTDAGQRAAYLNEACGDDAALRQQVEALLREHDQLGSFLEGPAAHQSTIAQPNESAGLVIAGRYKLLEQIGEGGMGTVWMAEQTEPVQRRVAIKLIKPGMDSKQVVSRFEAERQALALMDHPNIAKVHDGGLTEAGRPFFVMELVKGTPFTKYCDEKKLPVRERLELFADVCRAIQHAHQKGIIHRDLKPSNVLVAPYDGKPVVKVIDFGVAKATSQKLTEATLFTGFGAVVGTPEYMSPEQAELNNQDIDTRSDIYSLGVLLYELLTGTTPLTKQRVKEAALLEVLRVIREEEAPRPSARLSTTEELPSIAAVRGVEPAKLSKLVRGELDWIVMKALEKDRNRRYESANGLAMDVQRYLANETVLAGPPSNWYRLRKFVSRHKTALAIVVALGWTLLAAAAVSTASLVKRSAALAREAATNDRLENTVYYQTIDLAERARSAGQVRLAEELLLGCKPTLRGWEWRYVQRLRYGAEPAIRHPSHLFSLAISGDGTLIAVAGSDGTITIRDSQRMNIVRVLRAHASWARAVAFTPDGLHLVSGGWDRHVRLWDTKNGTMVWEAPCESMVQCVAVDPKGRWIASSGGSGHIQFWRLDTGAPTATINNHDSNVFTLAFSPDGQFLAGGGSDRTVRIWRTSDLALAHELGPQREQILGLAYSPDGRLLAAASGGFYEKEQHGELCVWETDSGRLLHRLDSPDGSTFCVAFSPDGSRLAAGGSAEPVVKVWDTATGMPAITLHGHSDAIWSVAFSPDGYRLFSAGGDHTLRVWDATPLSSRPGSERSVLSAFDSEVHGIAFHPDSQLLATACPDGDLQVWNALTGKLVRSMNAPGTCCVAFSRNGVWMAAGSFGVVRVWDMRSWKLKHKFLTNDVVRALSFHPAGNQLAAATGQFVGVWNLATGMQQLELRDHANFLLSAIYHPSGESLASAGFEGEVKVWNVGSMPTPRRLGGLLFPSSPFSLFAAAWLGVRGMPPRNLPGHSGRVSCLAYSPDGRHLVSAGMDGVFHRWDTATWNRTTPAIGHRGHVLALAYSPDGTRLASAGDDGVVRVWDANDFHALFALRGHADAISGIAYSIDGRLLASVSFDRTVRIWDANPPPDSAAATRVDLGQ